MCCIVVQMSPPLRTATPLLKLVIIGGFVTGIALAGFGVWLVYLGATGRTEFSFFGQTFKSTNVGVTGIFLGAATIVLLVRRALKSLDQAS